MDTKWFKERMKAAGVTQDMLGEAIGRDRSIVSRTMSGKVKLPIERVDAVAEMLNVSPSELLARAGLQSISIAPVANGPINRIAHLRGLKEIEPAALAKSVGVHVDYLRRLEAMTPAEFPSELIPAFARALRANRADLFEGYVPPLPTLLAPILDKVRAGPFVEVSANIEDCDLHDVERWTWVQQRKHTVFCLVVEGDSMDEIAPEGNLLVVDYENKGVKIGDVGIFRCGNEATFKRLREDAQGLYLEPVSSNRRHQPIFPSEDTRIETIGSILEVKREWEVA